MEQRSLNLVIKLSIDKINVNKLKKNMDQCFAIHIMISKLLQVKQLVQNKSLKTQYKIHMILLLFLSEVAV